MLAPASLPQHYQEWNRSHGAPYGSTWWSGLLDNRYLGRFARFPVGRWLWRRRMTFPDWVLRRIGAFGFQPVSATRRFEYPWALEAASLEAGMCILDLGAGAAGLQFLLPCYGVDVTSVDPLVNPSEEVDWVFTESDFARLNRAFGSKIRFLPKRLEAADLKAESFDRAFCISVLEHLRENAAEALLDEFHRVLKPGGRLILTVDLFLDCWPFAQQHANKYGSNIALGRLIDLEKFHLVDGRCGEICGFPEFDAEAIRERRHEFLEINGVMSQCLVLEKRIGT